MKEIVGYIKKYVNEINKSHLFACSLLTGILIYCNYDFQIDKQISDQQSSYSWFYYRYLISFIALGLPYFFYLLLNQRNYFKSSLISFLIIISPAIFSLKIAMDTDAQFTSHIVWNDYWNQVFYWPARLVVMIAILFILWKLFYRNDSFFGLTTKNFKWKPYFFLLLLMIPLIIAASTQHDFLVVYPKMQNIESVSTITRSNWIYKLLFEISYGSDFISIELFFRGFLVLAFAKVVGKDAIIPMACFYCTIHFGKPLGECISSYFGGILLGIVVFHTRSIFGGLVVHLGIAWLMELGGYLGNLLK